MTFHFDISDTSNNIWKSAAEIFYYHDDFKVLRMEVVFWVFILIYLIPVTISEKALLRCFIMKMLRFWGWREARNRSRILVRANQRLQVGPISYMFLIFLGVILIFCLLFLIFMNHFHFSQSLFSWRFKIIFV